jgi:hypothetical protein
MMRHPHARSIQAFTRRYAVAIAACDRTSATAPYQHDLSKVLAFIAPWRAGLTGVVVHLANTTAIKKYDGLSTAVTRPMRATWPICCAWASCLPALFCPRSTERCATWPASACNWCAAAPPTSSPSRTSRRGSPASGSRAIRSNNWTGLLSASCVSRMT